MREFKRHTMRGRGYEETGVFRVPEVGEPCLTKSCRRPITACGGHVERGQVRHILHKLPLAAEGRKHTTEPGRTFEETGEVRPPVAGEFYLAQLDGEPQPMMCLCSGSPKDDQDGNSRIILRPAPRRKDTAKHPRSWANCTVTVNGAQLLGEWVQTTPRSYADCTRELVAAYLEVGPETRARKAEAKVEEVTAERDRIAAARDVYMAQNKWLRKQWHRDYHRATDAERERDAAQQRVTELLEELKATEGVYIHPLYGKLRFTGDVRIPKRGEYYAHPAAGGGVMQCGGVSPGDGSPYRNSAILERVN